MNIATIVHTMNMFVELKEFIRADTITTYATSGPKVWVRFMVNISIKKIITNIIFIVNNRQLNIMFFEIQ